MTLRDILFEQKEEGFTHIFINDNGDQYTAYSVREALEFLRGKALQPVLVDSELVDEHSASHYILTATNGVSLTFTTHKEVK